MDCASSLHAKFGLEPRRRLTIDETPSPTAADVMPPASATSTNVRRILDNHTMCLVEFATGSTQTLTTASTP